MRVNSSFAALFFGEGSTALTLQICDVCGRIASMSSGVDDEAESKAMQRREVLRRSVSRHACSDNTGQSPNVTNFVCATYSKASKAPS